MRSAYTHNRVDHGIVRSFASRPTSQRVSGSNRDESESDVLSGRINHTNRMKANHNTTNVAARMPKVRSIARHRLPAPTRYGECRQIWRSESSAVTVAHHQP